MPAWTVSLILFCCLPCEAGLKGRADFTFFFSNLCLGVMFQVLGMSSKQNFGPLFRICTPDQVSPCTFSITVLGSWFAGCALGYAVSTSWERVEALSGSHKKMIQHKLLKLNMSTSVFLLEVTKHGAYFVCQICPLFFSFPLCCPLLCGDKASLSLPGSDIYSYSLHSLHQYFCATLTLWQTNNDI